MNHTVGLVVVANDWRDYKIGYVFVRLNVVSLWVELRLGHALEVIVVNRLGLSKCSSSKSLIGGNANHVVTV